MNAESVCQIGQGDLPQHIAFRIRHHRTYLAMYLVGLTVLLIAVALLAYFVEDYTTLIEQWVKGMGRWGPVLFIVGAALLCVLFVPQAVTGVAGGVLFGVGWGLLYVFLSELLAAWASFLLGRHFFRGTVTRLIEKHPRLGLFNRATPSKRLRLMFLMRLAPANFSLLNYICGVSNVRLWRYLLTLIGVIPGNLCTVYAGDVARHVSRLAGGEEHYRTMHYVLMIGGLFVAVLAVYMIARTAYRMAKEDCLSPTPEEGDAVGTS